MLTLARALAAWPVPAERTLCRGEPGQRWGPRWPGLSLHCQDAPGCGQSRADAEAPPGGAPSRLTQGTFLLTLHTGVSSEARGTGAGPLHWVTGGSIMTLTLLGTVFPEEATGTSWGGGRGVSAKPGPALPSQAGAQGIANASSAPQVALEVHMSFQKVVPENLPRGRPEAMASWSLRSV